MTAISVLLDAGVQEERIIFISLIAAPLVCHAPPRGHAPAPALALAPW
jgi:uracil phosphoribosyltransferase